jgi:hypothetical protein
MQFALRKNVRLMSRRRSRTACPNYTNIQIILRFFQPSQSLLLRLVHVLILFCLSYWRATDTCVESGTREKRMNFRNTLMQGLLKTVFKQIIFFLNLKSACMKIVCNSFMACYFYVKSIPIFIFQYKIKKKKTALTVSTSYRNITASFLSW